MTRETRDLLVATAAKLRSDGESVAEIHRHHTMVQSRDYRYAAAFTEAADLIDEMVERLSP